MVRILPEEVFAMVVGIYPAVGGWEGNPVCSRVLFGEFLINHLIPKTREDVGCHNGPAFAFSWCGWFTSEKQKDHGDAAVR